MEGNLENIAYILYAADNKFAEIMGVSMLSLFDNSTDMEEIIVYILDGGISPINQERIESVCKQYQRRLPVWIKAKDISEELGIKILADRGSLNQYARIFLSCIPDEKVAKILYLDCDVILNESVRELWNQDMRGKTIAALMDAFSQHYRVNIGLQPKDIMFNSGVMLIDLKRWKECGTEKRLLDFIMSMNGRIQQGDQGALNAILSQDVYCFEPRFNSVTIFYDFTYKEMLRYRKPSSFYSQSEILKAVEQPVVVHFTTSFLSKRPWVEGCGHRYVRQWLKYKALSPWRDEPLRKDETPGWKRCLMNCYYFLPRGLAVCLAGLMQAYIRPLKNRMVLERRKDGKGIHRKSRVQADSDRIT